ncbi:cupin domain-containing protein [Chamaesiphon minutus]|uniref:Cupin domain-containing protein n=1 Tax=Chamaesiphon minutus (strain ATCC 27169 / PCC 6605) TaxID=1173020 RepID=K9UJ79_CHAP6|nr:cupin domain-containing protein [Chamaesiphon minutus]AFY94713.1 cupin domain-containing protein [Chamaesiphon minutus PCC 6605]
MSVVIWQRQDMNVIDIKSEIESIEQLEITDRTTATDASAAMRMLGDFDRYAIGMACFAGSTPWERHPEDELLQILAGTVNVTILDDRNRSRQITLSAGTMFVVPKGWWHQQHSSAGVKLLFVTSQTGNDHSATDPRLI